MLGTPEIISKELSGSPLAALVGNTIMGMS